MGSFSKGWTIAGVAKAKLFLNVLFNFQTTKLWTVKNYLFSRC